MAGCIFCGRTPVTNAHVLRKAWISEIAPLSVRFRHRRGPRQALNRRGGWINETFDIKVKAVCGDCNGGWMDTLDRRAEDTFLTHAALGYSVRIGAIAEKETLALWAALVVALYDQTGKSPFLPPRVHTDIYEGRVPDGLQVLAYLTDPPDGRDVAWTAGRHRTLTGLMRSGATHVKDFYFLTLGIQKLVLHIVIPTEGTPSGVELVRRGNGTCRQIWPALFTPLIFPPPQTLRWEDALDLPDEIERILGKPTP